MRFPFRRVLEVSAWLLILTPHSCGGHETASRRAVDRPSSQASISDSRNRSTFDANRTPRARRRDTQHRLQREAEVLGDLARRQRPVVHARTLEWAHLCPGRRRPVRLPSPPCLERFTRRHRAQPGTGDPQLGRAPSLDGTTPACPRDRASQSQLQRCRCRAAGRLRPRRLTALLRALEAWSSRPTVRADPARAPRFPQRAARGLARQRLAAAPSRSLTANA